jgi:hypothetical protein
MGMQKVAMEIFMISSTPHSGKIPLDRSNLLIKLSFVGRRSADVRNTCLLLRPGTDAG